jgi:glycosyltransferase involved in cell wall biosynthesis
LAETLVNHDSRRLTVLLIAPLLPPYSGGAAIYYRDLAKELSKRIDVVVLSRLAKGTSIIESSGSLRIYRMLLPLTDRGRTLLSAINIVTIPFALFYLWIKYRPSLIHLHSTSVGITRNALVWIRLFGVPTVLDVRDEYFGKFVNCRSIVHYIVLSERMASRLRSFGVQDNRVSIVERPLPTDLYQNAERRIEPSVTVGLRLVFIGELIEEKGIFDLLSAFRESISRSHYPLHLTIIGSGTAKQKITQFIEENLLGDNIALLGNVPHSDVIDHLAESDALVLPSKAEGVPTSVLEALFLHKPVIASNVGALPSMIIGNYNGVLIPPGDPERLTEAILSLSNAETRFRLSGGLPRRVPTWNEIVSKLVAVYLGFAQHHG